MKPQTLLAFLLVAAAAAAGGYFAASRGHSDAPLAASAAPSTRRVAFYQSPMHPWIKSDKPGKCTICGMDLVPVYEGQKGIEQNGNQVVLGGATASVIGVETVEVKRAPLVRSLRVAGILDDDDTRHRIISAYTRSRLEKLYVNQVGQEFSGGQPLASIYSPELLQAKQELHALARMNTAKGTANPLLAAARERLLRIGMLDTQIDALVTVDTVPRETELIAPMGGEVLVRNAYEGNYVEAGAPILTIADLSKLWFVFDAYESDLGWLQVGQRVQITTPSHPGQTIEAPITFIDPNLQEATRTARVRVVVDNSARTLLHRQTAYGVVHVETPETLIVPRSAVLFTQGAPVVYVDSGSSAYEPRPVKLGRVGDQAYEVTSGVNAGDRVVSQGALLLDGQAQLAHASHGMPSATTAMAETPVSTKTATATGAKSDIEAVKPLVLATADSADALGRDDLAAYQKSVPALKSAFAEYASAVPDAKSGPLSQFTAGLRDGPDLKGARESFEVFSTAVADLARQAHLHHEKLVKVYECPMSPVMGTARWVQRDGPIKNPFFGTAMSNCGSEVP